MEQQFEDQFGRTRAKINQDFAEQMGFFTKQYDLKENKWEEIGPPVQRRRRTALAVCFIHFGITVISQITVILRKNITALALNFVFMGVIGINIYGLMRLQTFYIVSTPFLMILLILIQIGFMMIAIATLDDDNEILALNSPLIFDIIFTVFYIVFALIIRTTKIQDKEEVKNPVPRDDRNLQEFYNRPGAMEKMANQDDLRPAAPQPGDFSRPPESKPYDPSQNGPLVQAPEEEKKEEENPSAPQPAQVIRADSKVSESNLCAICFDRRNDATLYKCGHICCYECAKDMQKRKQDCPICRKPIIDIIRMFKA